MGGAAFAHAAANGQPTLRTPRMSPEVYEHLKLTYLRRLKDYFPDREVITLREAPEKTDFGDIDFTIASDRPVDPMHLASALGAAAFLSYGGLHMLAVPVDGTKHPRIPVKYTVLKTAEPVDQLSEETYAQIDIDLVKPDLFAWHSFYSSYGDLSSILGQIVSNIGFTVTDKAMMLRLRELDDAKDNSVQLQISDKQGMLFLSNDPDQVMEFLGLNLRIYQAGFSSMNDFYAWLARCRLLTPDYVGNLQYKRRDTSNQRQKEYKRPAIKSFFEEYLPTHVGTEGAEIEDPDMWRANLARRREQWRDEAVQFFEKREELEQMRVKLVKSISNQTADFLIKPIVSAHYGGNKQKVHEIVRAMRRWVEFENGQPRILAESHSDEESQLHFWLEGDVLRDPAAVNAWIEENWARCKALERENRKG